MVRYAARVSDLLAEAVYGLPRSIAPRSAPPFGGESRLLSDGRATGFLPLLEAGVVDPQSLIADAKSGVSGAGRKAEVGILLAGRAITSRPITYRDIAICGNSPGDWRWRPAIRWIWCSCRI